MHRILLIFSALVFLQANASAQKWEPLFNGKNLDGWETRGDCVWSVMDNGVLLGQRLHAKPGNPFAAWPVEQKQYQNWVYRQAWLYSKKEFGQFDLHVEYWIPPHANSGVSIRDKSRAHYAIGEPDAERPDLTGPIKSTPAHIGYEIQIIDGDSDKYPSGSVYTFVGAKTGLQKSGQWNSMDIESRNDMIRVKINGQLAAESPGDAARSKAGPIGLQLHDQFTFAMFRNIRIREIPNR